MKNEIKELFKLLRAHSEFIEYSSVSIQEYSKDKFIQHKVNEIKFRAEDSAKLCRALQELFEAKEAEGKTLILDWIKYQRKRSNSSIDKRLFNILKGYVHSDVLRNGNDNYVKYIDDMTKEEFIKIKNAGKKTMERFLELTKRK